MHAPRAAARLALLAVRWRWLRRAGARADAGWFESGDARCASTCCCSTTPKSSACPSTSGRCRAPRCSTRSSNAKEHFATNAAVIAALERVRARLAPRDQARLVVRRRHARRRAGSAARLRHAGARGRRARRAGCAYDERPVLGWRSTSPAVADPADGRRAARSTVRTPPCNSATGCCRRNTLDRWWGPAHEGSLILSNNARPMPTVMVERAEARAFETPLAELARALAHELRHQPDGERARRTSTRRCSWPGASSSCPSRTSSSGFSRTAQFCGEQLECNLRRVRQHARRQRQRRASTPRRRTSPATRWPASTCAGTRRIGNLPYAIYCADTSAKTSRPIYRRSTSRSSASKSGSRWRTAVCCRPSPNTRSTTCSANTGSGPYYNCAYNQGRFNVEGYRYRRPRRSATPPIATRRTGRSARLTPRPAATLWTATARTSRLNRDDFDDVRNTVSAGARRLRRARARLEGPVVRRAAVASISASSRIEPAGGERDVEPFGFVGWRHEFQP